jgi:amino acid transporter
MKKISTFMSSMALFGLSVMPALAAEDPFGVGYGTYLGLGTSDIKTGIMTIIQYMLGFLGIIAIIIILYGGFTWMTAAGNEEKVGKAKQIITAGIIGLVIIFVSYALVTFVISQLLSATGAPAAV